MAVSTISSEINDSAGGSIANVRVVARLLPRPAFETATGVVLAATLEATSDSAGQYSFVLTETTSITPSGSYYEIIEYVPDRYGGPVKHTIQVGAANTTVYASLVSVPPAPGSAIYLTQTSADARYQQITGYGVSGDLSTIDPDDAANAGVLTTAARSDHQHAIVAAVAGASTYADVAAEGAASSFARSDHKHSRESYYWRSGDLVISARSTAGSDELLCDGTAVSRTTYADLFAAISTTYGVGNGTTTFNVPEFRGRTIIGAGTGTYTGTVTARTRGDKGGVETHGLSAAELATHAHTVSITSGGQSVTHTHSVTAWQNGGGALFGGTPGYSADSNTFNTGNTSVDHTHLVSGNTGTGTGLLGTAHQNMSPFGVANVFIKI